LRRHGLEYELRNGRENGNVRYQAVPIARKGHRQRRRPSRAVDTPDRAIDRTLEKPRQGPFLAPRPPENGGPAPEFARLFEPVPSRTLQKVNRRTEPAEIAAGRISIFSVRVSVRRRFEN